MLMLPSAITGMSSKYASPFEPCTRFALDLTDAPSTMSPRVGAQSCEVQQLESLQPLAEDDPSLEFPRYGSPTLA
jgi:hypothetical protein